MGRKESVSLGVAAGAISFKGSHLPSEVGTLSRAKWVVSRWGCCRMMASDKLKLEMKGKGCPGSTVSGGKMG